MIESPSDKIDTEKISAALVELAGTIKRAYDTGDADLYISTFDVDAILSMPGRSPIRGSDALRDSFLSRPPLPTGATFEVVPSEVKVINADWAYAFGTDTLTIPTVHTSIVQTMTFMVLIRRTEQGWKGFREVISDDGPASGAEQ